MFWNFKHAYVIKTCDCGELIRIGLNALSSHHDVGMKPWLVFFETSSIGAWRCLQPLFPTANPIDELNLNTAPRPYPILNPDLVQDVPQLPLVTQVLTSNQIKHNET